ncbi:MAG: valine--pyruvate transaminase [FCB group bacterium]|nr:valine--pyruvate transaminase [FCB group bacterium]
MKYKLSQFGKKIEKVSGIKQLMDDLGQAMTVNKDMLMLGGGNPAHIPAVQRRFRQGVKDILESDRTFEETIGNYDTPQGNPAFLEALAGLLRNELGWSVTAKNIVLTNGSQSAFFVLFNMFAGRFEDGSYKKILLPLAPEYIGYSDVGLAANVELFQSFKPEIEYYDNNLFKYHIDFEKVRITDDVGAVCVSRPTNPTGNVVTDDEIARLSSLAKARNVPLIIDNAYGIPFPNIIFTEVKPYWDEQTIVCQSLSKLGLPGARTGIIIAAEEIVEALSEMNAVITLAPGSVGAALAYDIVKSGEIIKLSRDVIKPYYEKKAQQALNQFHYGLRGVDYCIHKPEGALFLWIWFKNLPITTDELYERLKKRGVLVVPGKYFFAGLSEKWDHADQCIRVTYSQDDKIVEAGINIICEEVKNMVSVH